MTDSEKRELPSTDTMELIYELSMKSYDLAERRFEAMNGRIQGLMSLAIALLVTVPVLAEALDFDLHFLWHGLAGVVLLVAMVLGFRILLTRKLDAVSPRDLYKNFRHFPREQYMGEMILHAGESLEINGETIRYKRQGAASMSILLALCAVCSILGAFL